MPEKKTMKYTFFLKNDNKIVLSDSGSNIIKNKEKIEKLIKINKKNMATAFSTDTDLAIFFPQSISAIHISKISDEVDDEIETDEIVDDLNELDSDSYIEEDDDVNYEESTNIKSDIEDKFLETTNFISEFNSDENVEDTDIDLEDESIEEFSKLNDLSDE